MAVTAVAVLGDRAATFVMRNGERLRGELSYKGGSAYTLNGRDIESTEVAVIAFVNDDPSATELRQIPPMDNNPSELERHVFVTRDGKVLLGKLYKFSPDGEMVTYDARAGGRRDVPANDLARIYINPGAARSVYSGILNTAPPPQLAAPTGGGIIVNGSQPWTDTGINVRKGEWVAFSATGQVRIAHGDSPETVANPNGAGTGPASRQDYPIPTMAVGGLIGRVGNAKPFEIGSETKAIRMTDAGRLSLGINDVEFGDNSGAFGVTIKRPLSR